MRTAEPASCSPLALILAAIAVAAIGLLFSLLPYALWFHSTGSVVYVADKDNQYYLQLASQAYFSDGLRLTDVTVAGAATIYQGAQFIPAVALARMLGLPVLDVNLIWRIWAGIAVSLLFFCIFFHWLRTPWASAFCAILMLVDCGILLAQPGFLQMVRTYQAAVGQLPTLYDGQDLLNQWRVIDPAVGLPVLLLQILLVSIVVEGEKNHGALLAAGIATGALFYVWFYYWTAAAGALILAFVIDRRNRRSYAAIFGIAMLVGGPAIVAELLAKSRVNPDALRRFGVYAPVPRFGFFLLPKIALGLLVLIAVWIWRKPRREGLYLWCVAVAAIVASNNHVFTGLDLRAGHWRYVWGVGVSILIILMAARIVRYGLRARPAALAMLAAVVLLFEISSGLALRKIEVWNSINSTLERKNYIRFVAQTAANPLWSFPAGAVIAGDSGFCAFESIVSGARPLAGYAALISPDVSDRDWETRTALNARLEGIDERAFGAIADAAGRDYGWGESADPHVRERVTNGMMQAYARTGADLDAEISRFHVRYVAIPSTRSAPDYLKHGWRPIEPGPRWRIWERE
jgi:hypothetical protein